MCLPAAAGLPLIGASTGLQLMGARSEYKQQRDVARDAAQQASRSAVLQYTQLQVRQDQETQRAQQAIRENADRARVAGSSLKTSIGESGIGGNTAAVLTAGFERSALLYEGAVIRNKAFLDANFAAQATSIQDNARADAANAYARIQRPNYLGILIQGLGSALSLGSKMNAQAPLDVPETAGAVSTAYAGGSDPFAPGYISPSFRPSTANPNNW